MVYDLKDDIKEIINEMVRDAEVEKQYRIIANKDVYGTGDSPTEYEIDYRSTFIVKLSKDELDEQLLELDRRVEFKEHVAIAMQDHWYRDLTLESEYGNMEFEDVEVLIMWVD